MSGAGRAPRTRVPTGYLRPSAEAVRVCRIPRLPSPSATSALGPHQSRKASRLERAELGAAPGRSSGRLAAPHTQRPAAGAAVTEATSARSTSAPRPRQSPQTTAPSTSPGTSQPAAQAAHQNRTRRSTAKVRSDPKFQGPEAACADGTTVFSSRCVHVCTHASAGPHAHAQPPATPHTHTPAHT